MTLNEIRALIAESDKTGRLIQYRQNDQSEWRILPPDDDCAWNRFSNYRVAPPEPPKPREWWRETATGMTIPYDPRDRNEPGWVRVREVMEGEKS